MVLTTSIGLDFFLAHVILASNIDPLILLLCKGLLFNICPNSLDILLCLCKLGWIQMFKGSREGRASTNLRFAARAASLDVRSVLTVPRTT